MPAHLIQSQRNLCSAAMQRLFNLTASRGERKVSVVSLECQRNGTGAASAAGRGGGGEDEENGQNEDKEKGTNEDDYDRDAASNGDVDFYH